MQHISIRLHIKTIFVSFSVILSVLRVRTELLRSSTTKQLAIMYTFTKTKMNFLSKLHRKYLKVLDFGRLRPFCTFFEFLSITTHTKFNKTPAKHRDIIRDTLTAKKYGEGEARTHGLLARKHEKISCTSPGSNPRTTGWESNK